jgi:hypothetical protein
MDDVSVHYDSSEPAKLNAAAFTRGTDIHLRAGARQHLAHEAWHVAQQKQGRVRAAFRANGLGINRDPTLESEADAMGSRALARDPDHNRRARAGAHVAASDATVQLYGLAGYVPMLAQPARAPNGIAYAVATFARPAGFDPATVVWMYANSPQQIANHPVTGVPTVFYECANCQGWFQYEAMQIGHEENWRTYVQAKLPADTAEATDAYNDLMNLQLECATCNAGHAFEEHGKDKDDYDKTDPFIDDSSADPVADARAFAELRNNILPDLRGIHVQ